MTIVCPYFIKALEIGMRSLKISHDAYIENFLKSTLKANVI